MFDKLEKVPMPMSDVLSENRALIAIHDGFLITTPLLIVGSIFLLIANFPIPGWFEFQTGVFGAGQEEWFKAVSRATFSCTALLIRLGIGYAMAREFGGGKTRGVAVTLVSFFILQPAIHNAIGDTKEVALEGAFAGLSFGNIGMDGIFMTLYCSILCVLLFTWVYKKGWTIKMPRGVPPAVADSFAALIPSVIVLLACFLIRIFFEFTPFETAQGFIFTVLQMPMEGLGDTLRANTIYSFICTFLWFLGINGPAVMSSVYFIGNVLTADQLLALEAGTPNNGLPHIFTNPFSDFFANFGGGRSTLPLVICMPLFCKSERIKVLSRLSTVPGIFGINESVIFGLPIVLSPIMVMPFIFVSLFNLVASYLLAIAEILPEATDVNLPWTTPIGLSGRLSTGNWIAAIWQTILLVIGYCIYFPFIKALDKGCLHNEESSEDTKEGDILFDDLSLDGL